MDKSKTSKIENIVCNICGEEIGNAIDMIDHAYYEHPSDTVMGFLTSQDKLRKLGEKFGNMLRGKS